MSLRAFSISTAQCTTCICTLSFFVVERNAFIAQKALKPEDYTTFPPNLSLIRINLMSGGRKSTFETLKSKEEFLIKENFTTLPAAKLADLGFQSKLQLNLDLLSLICRTPKRVSHVSGSSSAFMSLMRPSASEDQTTLDHPFVSTFIYSCPFHSMKLSHQSCLAPQNFGHDENYLSNFISHHQTYSCFPIFEGCICVNFEPSVLHSSLYFSSRLQT